MDTTMAIINPQWFLRIAMSVVFLYYGLTKKPNGFAAAFNLPLWMAYAVIFAEVSAGLGYFVGDFDRKKYFGYTITQWASLAAIPVLLGAIYLVHYKNGFSVGNNGVEYPLVLLMIALYFYFA